MPGVAFDGVPIPYSTDQPISGVVSYPLSSFPVPVDPAERIPTVLTDLVIFTEISPLPICSISPPAPAQRIHRPLLQKHALLDVEFSKKCDPLSKLYISLL